MNFTIIITTLIICCTAITLSDKWLKAKEENTIISIPRQQGRYYSYASKIQQRGL